MKGDHWWKYGGVLDSPTQSARHLIATYLECGEPLFQRYDSVEKIASMISVDEINRKSFVDKFGGIIPVRAVLTMARIHNHLGNTIQSKQFAEVGLINIGHADLRRSEFQNILSTT